MSYTDIRFEIAGGVARLMLHRPEKLNSFTTRMHEEVRDALARTASEPGVRVLLLTGAGRGFCAGQDLGDREMAPGRATEEAGAVDLGESIARFYAPLVLSLRALPLPVVCAVNGVAAGAGVSVAMACDLVIACRSASFIQSFAKLGLIPDTGGTYFLPRRVGTARAMGLALLGGKLPAQTAADWGLIWRCVEDEAFAAETEALVAQLAAGPTLGLARTKQAIYASASATLEQQLSAECEAMRELGFSQDYREGVRAFLEKRAPVFHGR